VVDILHLAERYEQVSSCIYLRCNSIEHKLESEELWPRYSGGSDDLLSSHLLDHDGVNVILGHLSSYCIRQIKSAETYLMETTTTNMSAKNPIPYWEQYPTNFLNDRPPFYSLPFL